MLRPLIRTLWLSSLLLATGGSLASAQGVEVTNDSTSDSAPTASAQRQGRNWFVSLLRRGERRGDDTVGTPGLATAAPVDTESANAGGSIVPENAVPARRVVRSFKSRKDSLEWRSARNVAMRSSGYRIIVDLFARELYVLDRDDTLRVAPAATAMNATLSYGGRTWRFETPRGVRVVRGKEKDPVWTPPEWHFAEVALEHGLKLRSMSSGQQIRLKDGTILTSRRDEAGIIRKGSKTFVPLVLDEHVVFDNTLFIPPQGTKHRSIQGELGHYKLDLGDGYLLHGTPYARSIGAAVTHGCVRLADDDIEWLYENVPVGTKVYMY
ncbi:MAG TPA: L,D-transpeptidase [Gemmatimonadaceae bacterium]|nr:L,D-transpeptidase [Gemmatimonadaceae bacterium]